MNEKQFDPLDDRFRQAAEQFEPPYDPQDWIAMEKLLDGKKKKRKIFPIWWITDGIMVGMALLFVYQANKNWDKSPKVELIPHSVQTTAANPKTLGQETGEPKLNPEIFHEQKGSQNSLLAFNKAEPASGLEKQTSKNRLKNHQNGPIGPITKPRFSQPPKTPVNAENSLVFLPGETGNTMPPVQANQMVTRNEKPVPIVLGIDEIKNADSLGMEQPVMVHVKSADLPNADYQADTNKINPKTMEPGEIDSAENVKTEKVGYPNSRKGEFFVSAGFGLEKSGVKESSPGPSGIIYGGFAGYQFHKDWSIKLGILFTDKNYSGGSGIYKLPPGSYYQEITDFNAICKIIEIPLLISYQFKHGKKSNWLISAGPVTSIMNQEEYHYNYINNSGGTGYGKRYYSTGEVDWFSGLRISPAYERFLGNRISLSAEPYIQLPLSGVGQGSVKLYSLGLLVTTSIYLNSAKRK